MRPITRDGVPAGVERARMAARYAATRSETEALAAPLSAEDQTVQSMPDCSPTKWHRAHTTWFFETFVLARFAAGLSRFRPGLRLSLQFLLRGGGAAPSAARARAGVAAGHRRDRALSPACRRGDGRAHRRVGGGAVARSRAAARARLAARAAASGADPDGHQACAVAQSAAAGLSRASRGRAALGAAARLACGSRRPPADRPGRRGLRLRQ